MHSRQLTEHGVKASDQLVTNILSMSFFWYPGYQHPIYDTNTSNSNQKYDFDINAQVLFGIMLINESNALTHQMQH